MKVAISTLKRLALVSISSIWLTATGCGTSVYSSSAYNNEVVVFRNKRVAFLKSEKGYLNLVGLFWLKEGENSFGSGFENYHQFPDAFPENLGSAVKSGKIVTFNYSEPVTLKDDDVTSATIDVDDRSQVFSWGPFRWFILESGGQYAIRMRNLKNPVLNEALELNFYEVKESWRITGRYTPYNDIQSRTITNIRDIEYKQKAPGMINFEFDGQSYSFEPRINSEGLSVIFTDKTTGKQTFAGGRFLLLEEPDEDRNIVLDFNKALNFPCAYNAYTTCPIPPENNRLSLAVSAGEKAYSK